MPPRSKSTMFVQQSATTRIASLSALLLCLSDASSPSPSSTLSRSRLRARRVSTEAVRAFVPAISFTTKCNKIPFASKLYSSRRFDRPATTGSPKTAIVTDDSSMGRADAQRILTDVLCPSSEERDRCNAGMQVFSTSEGSDGFTGKVITNSDPRNEYAYGEFPFGSFDLLVDRAMQLLPTQRADENAGERMRSEKNIMVDLGSGCGRLVLYAALTRGGKVEPALDGYSNSNDTTWDFHGVEIGSQLHSLAVNSLKRGVDHGWFSFSPDRDQNTTNYVGMLVGSKSRVEFHNGNALLVDDACFPFLNSANVQQSNNMDETRNAIQSILSKATILFAYSTVWETNPSHPFDRTLEAMILSPKWSRTLAKLCPKGCVAITTDRALNPEDGWVLLDRMDVANPSVWGSVGYISVLEKSIEG